MNIASTFQPIETIREIISYLHGKDLLNAIATCKTFKNAVKEDTLWKERCVVSNIDMPLLFERLGYKSYEHMFIEQVHWKPYTFIIGKNYHLKVALFEDLIFLYVIEYESGSTKATVSFIELNVNEDILQYRFGLENAIAKIAASKLIQEKWLKPGSQALKDNLHWEYFQKIWPNDTYVVDLAFNASTIQFFRFAMHAIKEIILYGEVRWLLGRSFRIMCEEENPYPALYDLDAEPDQELRLIVGVADYTDSWSYFYLYFHFDDRYDGLIPNGFLPPRFHEWIQEHDHNGTGLYEAFRRQNKQLYFYRYDDEDLLCRYWPDEECDRPNTTEEEAPWVVVALNRYLLNVDNGYIEDSDNDLYEDYV